MAVSARSLVSLLLCSVVTFAQNSTHKNFRAVQINAGDVIGQVRSFQGVNGPPAPIIAGFPSLIPQYRDLRIQLVRTHDFMGPADIDAHFEYDNHNLAALIPDTAQRARVVEVGNKDVIFPDAGADPEKAASYNFGPTDKVLAAIHASGAEIYFRIGRSWGADINPPADFDRYADVVKHVAMHYNQGWADGFHYKIRYWEFWNEPDGSIFWAGTPQQFYSLYEKTARALKSVDSTLKVGGDALAWADKAGPYREGFLDYCAEHNVPLDFFSWHVYTNRTEDPYNAVQTARVMRKVLDTHGFPRAENILSEWNLSADFTEAAKIELQSAHNAAYVAAALSYFQDAPLDAAMFYRGDAVWMGLFDRQGGYFKPAYAFRAMGRMLDTPQRLAVTGGDKSGFAVLAGRSADGRTVQILITNYVIPARLARKTSGSPATLQEQGGGEFRTRPTRTADANARKSSGYNLVVSHLPWGNSGFTISRYRLSGSQNFDRVEESSSREGTLRLSATLAPDSVELIVLQRN
jgi:hypothetical protein